MAPTEFNVSWSLISAVVFVTLSARQAKSYSVGHDD